MKVGDLVRVPLPPTPPEPGRCRASHSAPEIVGIILKIEKHAVQKDEGAPGIPGWTSEWVKVRWFGCLGGGPPLWEPLHAVEVINEDR